MKILVIGDPHGKLPVGLNAIVKKNRPDVIVVTGEIPPVPFEAFYPKSLLKKLNGEYDSSYSDKVYEDLVKKLDSYGIPVIVLMGNAYVTEGEKFALSLFKKHKNIFYKSTDKIKIKDRVFVLFDMIWEPWAYKRRTSDNLFAKKSRSKERIKKFNKLMKEAKDPILVSHAPPYGYLDKVPKVGRVGSKIVLKMIKKYHPKYVLCGHIHEGRGRKKIGKTLVINAGSRGEYEVIDIR